MPYVVAGLHSAYQMSILGDKPSFFRGRDLSLSPAPQRNFLMVSDFVCVQTSLLGIGLFFDTAARPCLWCSDLHWTAVQPNAHTAPHQASP